MSEPFTIDMSYGDTPKIEFAILVAPGYNPIDVIGPHTIMGVMPGVNLHLVWNKYRGSHGCAHLPDSTNHQFR